jgi:hypothetical protein
VLRARAAAFQAMVVGVAAGAMLLRVEGIPPWDSYYGEDRGVFLVGALTRPWHLLVEYAGYEQLGPRLIGQLVSSFLPLVDAGAGFAAAGAVSGALCALFIYHAAEGFIRSPWLRAMLGAGLVLLPLAPLDIIDSGVDSPWYAMTALFFAILWRPKSRVGMFAAALIAFYACSSEIVGFIYAPLLLIRVVALPRWREHAVTVGWLTGLLVQVPIVMSSYGQRIRTLSTPGQAVAFYCHQVVLRALGWRLSLHLIAIAGYNGATVIVGAVLAAGIGWALVTGDRVVRVFVVVALVTGFVQTVFEATITHYVVYQVPTSIFLPAARYSTIPIMLIDAIGIVAVDAYIRRRAIAPLLTAGVLTCVLAFGWSTDFRYQTTRSTHPPWQPYAHSLLDACARSKTGKIDISRWGGHPVPVECSRLLR